jgi:hypothetical protein
MSDTTNAARPVRKTRRATKKATAKATGEETAAATTNATAVTREDREKLLARMWVATVNSIIAGLENPEEAGPRAAMIQVSRQLLADNHISHDTLDRITGTTGASMQRILDDLPEADMGPSRAPSVEPSVEPARATSMRISPEIQAQLDTLPEPD